MNCLRLSKTTLIALALCLLPVFNIAFDGRVLDPDQKPDDNRLGKQVTLRDYHPFRLVNAAADWESRREEIRTRVKLAAGLFPEPVKTPLNTVISEKEEKDGFAVQKVYFESFPGHYVTGTLYSPAGESVSAGVTKGKRPVVLCPHGHWKDGRFYNAGEARAKAQIAEGGERFFNAALNPIQARCVQLARMGCLVFQYDMLGNADSLQFAEHRRGPRKEMTSSEKGKWGFVSPQAMLRLQTNFGLQSWNSVRALDFMLGQAEADPDRVLVTGASGGATQTMILAAIDDRVDASFPCVMASTAMQGGCTCENCCYLRIGQGNMDIAAALAPKPLGLTAADDWTVELKTKGHPDLVDLYKRLKAGNAYEAHFDIHFKHNYNHVSRTHMYQFVNKHFGLKLAKPVLERDFELMSGEELSVWNADGTRPKDYKAGAEHERELNQVWAEANDAQVAKALNEKKYEEFRAGWETILNRTLSDVGAVEFELIEKEKQPGFMTLAGLIKNTEAREVLPSLFYYPDNWIGTVTILLTQTGKSGLFQGAVKSPTETVKGYLDQGHAVVGVDLFGQGEFLDADQKSITNEAITYSGKKEVEPTSWQRSPVYYYGYNDSIFVRRVHDIFSTVKMVQTSEKWDVKSIQIAGQGAFGAVAQAAAAFSDGAFGKVEAKLDGFRFEKLDDFWGEHFVPGAVRLGDVEMLERISR